MLNKTAITVIGLIGGTAILGGLGIYGYHTAKDLDNLKQMTIRDIDGELRLSDIKEYLLAGISEKDMSTFEDIYAKYINRIKEAKNASELTRARSAYDRFVNSIFEYFVYCEPDELSYYINSGVL